MSRTVGYFFGVREVAELRRIAAQIRDDELARRVEAVVRKAEPVKTADHQMREAVQQRAN